MQIKLQTMYRCCNETMKTEWNVIAFKVVFLSFTNWWNVLYNFKHDRRPNAIKYICAAAQQVC